MRRRQLLTLLLLLPPLLALPVRAAERVALVIGNGGYQSLRPLDNPANDADAVAKKLAGLGFTLIGDDGRPAQGPVLNLGGDAFLLALKGFAQAAHGAEIALIYYAGHGMQIDGRSYLLPVDVPGSDIDLIQRNSLALDGVLKRLDGQARLTLAVFDACRAIPELGPALGQAMRDTGLGAGSFRGLGRVQQPGRQRIVAYSAAAGQLAADGSGDRHSPYTQALLAELDRPGVEVGDLFRQVAYRLGQGQGGQEPEVLIQGVPPGRFYLLPPGAPVAPASVPPPPSLGMGRTEVTQAQWRALMGNNPSRFKDCDQCPVELVSWDEALAYIAKLDPGGRQGLRLPTEAEWEYACRSGGKEERYCGGNDLDRLAWYDKNSGNKTHPVGGKAANGLGLQDMSGNVWEWCQDWYAGYPANAVKDPAGPETGHRRVARGGGWIRGAGYCRSAQRYRWGPANRGGRLGFRLARGP